jgi:hypothetical protein
MPFCLQMLLGDDDSGEPNSKEALDPELLRSWASYHGEFSADDGFYSRYL